MAYHHLADINGMTRLLASFLAPGGTLLVVDIVKSDESVRAAKELFEKRAKAEAEAGAGAGHQHDHGHDHAHAHEHSHDHGHGHGHGHGTEDGHTHGVAHVGGISEADIRAAFASASASASGENGNSGPIDMDTYAYVPFAHAKIWEMDMELFLAKATRK